ncbi:MAG: Hsp70 family protein [Anaerolineales bacterium]|nr:Hsp70 family protein [Anaerolineales bacterium]
MSAVIGIDLGTTFSAVGQVREGRPLILPNGHERIVPSVVGFNPAGQLLVGTPASNQYVLYPERTVRSIKRKMGTDETVSLLGREYTPAEISAIILREMKRIAETNLGEAVDRAVITVPAYFSDGARQATREAGEIAGFTVERIINEPTAAALAYGLDRVDEQQIIAVYDLGGGTFDVSIVELNQGVLEVRASHGDTHLGGDDFDQLLVDHLAELFQGEHGLDPREDRKALARLTRAAAQAKIELSAQPFARVREEYLLEKGDRPLHLDVEIERHTFEALIAGRLAETLTAFDQALGDAGLQASELAKILFVGGSTRIPLVWQMVTEHTGLEPMVEINPDEAVALGAGVQAAILAGEPIETVLVDVTPHSIGIEVAEWQLGEIVPDRYGIILQRNTTLPTRRAQVFSALFPDQTAINVKVYQGEAPIASHNTLLGEFLFEGLAPESRGEPPRITVEFDLDLNGILHVAAVDRGSGATRQVTLRAAHTRLSPSAKEASIRHVAQLEGVVVAAKADNDPLLARARQVLQEQREEVAGLSQLVTDLEAAKREGREDEAAELSERLLDLLYDLPDERDEEVEPEDDDRQSADGWRG